jgi:hypothetical protein
VEVIVWKHFDQRMGRGEERGIVKFGYDWDLNMDRLS